MPFEANISPCGDSTSEIQKFTDSNEARFRRDVRADVRKGPFTKSERDVVLAFVNHWFQHRKSPKGFVHPGRTKLAKRAGVSIATVKRTLAMLRDNGAIVPVGYLEGLHGKATEYTIDTIALTELCAKKKANITRNGGSNDPTQGRVKMTHRINNVITFPAKNKNTIGGAA